MYPRIVITQEYTRAWGSPHYKIICRLRNGGWNYDRLLTKTGKWQSRRGGKPYKAKTMREAIGLLKSKVKVRDFVDYELKKNHLTHHNKLYTRYFAPKTPIL